MPISDLLAPSFTRDGLAVVRRFTANLPRLNIKQTVFQLGDKAPHNSECFPDAAFGFGGLAPLQNFRTGAKPSSPHAMPGAAEAAAMAGIKGCRLTTWARVPRGVGALPSAGPLRPLKLSVSMRNSK